MSCLTVSNAFNRYTIIPKVNQPFSKNLISFTKFKIAWCVAWFTRNPICLGKRRLFLVRWLRILLQVIFWLLLRTRVEKILACNFLGLLSHHFENRCDFCYFETFLKNSFFCVCVLKTFNNGNFISLFTLTIMLTLITSSPKLYFFLMI